MPATIAVDKLEEIIKQCDVFISGMMKLGYMPDGQKTLKRLFGPVEAGQMVGRDRTTLARAEAQLGIKLQDIQRNPRTRRREGYTLAQIQTFREHFGTLPWRNPATDPAMIIACQNFKGGTAKSTTCIHLAHYLALKGYRVLVLDADHQATVTSMFGYMPDKDIKEEDTILPYLRGEQTTLHYAVRDTHWPNIKLIPSCLLLSDIETSIGYYLAQLPDKNARVGFLRETRAALDTVIEDFDVVLIDPPPSNGMIALSVLLAANALLIPTAPKMYDFTSTVSFFKMVKNHLETTDPYKELRWIKVLPTLYDNRYVAHQAFVTEIHEDMKDTAFEKVFIHHKEIMMAAIQFSTPYEAERPNQQLLATLDSVLEQVETAIVKEWPSKKQQLLQRGITI